MVTDEEIRDYIAALIRERDMWRASGQEVRAMEVEVELKRWAAYSKPPARRSEKRAAR